MEAEERAVGETVEEVMAQVVEAMGMGTVAVATAVEGRAVVKAEGRVVVKVVV